MMRTHYTQWRSTKERNSDNPKWRNHNYSVASVWDPRARHRSPIRILRCARGWSAEMVFTQFHVSCLEDTGRRSLVESRSDEPPPLHSEIKKTTSHISNSRAQKFWPLFRERHFSQLLSFLECHWQRHTTTDVRFSWLSLVGQIVLRWNNHWPMTS